MLSKLPTIRLFFLKPNWYDIRQFDVVMEAMQMTSELLPLISVGNYGLVIQRQRRGRAGLNRRRDA